MPTSDALHLGMEALKQGRYLEAVSILEACCKDFAPGTKEQLQAQMCLVKAYQKNGQLDRAIALCQQLATSNNPQMQIWAQQALDSMARASTQQPSNASELPQSVPPSPSYPKAGRAAVAGTPLAIAKTAGNLAIASSVTISLLFGMVFVLILALLLINDASNPIAGFITAVFLTLITNAAMFFFSPWLMDLTQGWLYGTQWISLDELTRLSPESAKVIQQVCRDRKLKRPRLGLIEDQNPTAFTYGSLPDTARVVISRGLLTYLDDDEVATVYAHELGHVVHWDFAVMTLASTLVQITYLIYTLARRMGQGDGKVKDAAQTAAMAAYMFYVIGTYLVLYLSRTREYFADHFAAEATGNPNGLSRALVKIAYGIVEEGQRSPEPSKLIEGTRALGIYDAKAATSTGTAYRIAASPEKIGRVFLWDMFNPWGWWMELSSTHPLTGKRIRALSTYAEQLGLPMEFDMGRIIGEGRNLSKTKLYGSFLIDLVLCYASAIGLLIGIGLGTAALMATEQVVLIFTFPLFGFGAGLLITNLVMYPSFSRAPQTDVLSLMSDPYASPLRGQPVKLAGKLIGRGDAGYVFGSDLKLQDKTGLIYLHYTSRFGPLGNFIFGAKRVKSLIGSQGATSGWFRRGLMPWVDLCQFQSESGTKIHSAPRFWGFVLGIGAIAFSLFLFAYFTPTLGLETVL